MSAIIFRCRVYGKDFEKKMTTQSDGFHRKIISYNIGNIKALVCYRVDCVESEEPINTSSLPSRNVFFSM